MKILSNKKPSIAVICGGDPAPGINNVLSTLAKIYFVNQPDELLLGSILGWDKVKVNNSKQTRNNTPCF